MALSPTVATSGFIPFSGEEKNGLVLVVSSVSEDSGVTEFVSSVFYQNRWHHTQADGTGIKLTSVKVENGKIVFSGYSNEGFDYATVFFVEGLPTA